MFTLACWAQLRIAPPPTVVLGLVYNVLRMFKLVLQMFTNYLLQIQENPDRILTLLL